MSDTLLLGRPHRSRSCPSGACGCAPAAVTRRPGSVTHAARAARGERLRHRPPLAVRAQSERSRFRRLQSVSARSRPNAVSSPSVMDEKAERDG